jgi:hypothetical protein
MLGGNRRGGPAPPTQTRSALVLPIGSGASPLRDGEREHHGHWSSAPPARAQPGDATMSISDQRTNLRIDPQADQAIKFDFIGRVVAGRYTVLEHILLPARDDVLACSVTGISTRTRAAVCAT